MKRRGFTLLELTIALSLLAGLMMVLVGLLRATMQASLQQMQQSAPAPMMEALRQVEDSWHHQWPLPNCPAWLEITAGSQESPTVLLKAQWLDENEALWWQALVLVSEDAWGVSQAKPSLAEVRLAPAAVDVFLREGGSFQGWQPLELGESVVLAGPLKQIELQLLERVDDGLRAWGPPSEGAWRVATSDAARRPVLRIAWEADGGDGVEDLEPLLRLPY